MRRTNPYQIGSIDAAILCGGLGTRLSSALPGTQKAAAQVGGVPFISLLIDGLYREGVRRFVLCAGYLAEQIEALDRSKWQGAEFALSIETDQLGTAGALKFAEPYFRSSVILVLNGDSYFDISYRDLITSFAKNTADLIIAVREVLDTSRYGRVRFDKDHRITAFQEKAEAHPAHPTRGFINGGIYFLKRELLSDIPPQQSVSLERECLPRWLSRRCFAFPGDGKFIDIGTPEDYARAQSLFNT